MVPIQFYCMERVHLLNISFCAPRKNESHTGIERHVGEWVWWCFIIFGWTIPLMSPVLQNVHFKLLCTSLSNKGLSIWNLVRVLIQLQLKTACCVMNKIHISTINLQTSKRRNLTTSTPSVKLVSLYAIRLTFFYSNYLDLSRFSQMLLLPPNVM